MTNTIAKLEINKGKSQGVCNEKEKSEKWVGTESVVVNASVKLRGWAIAF